MDKFRYEENESEDEESEKGVASNFANDVAIEDAHVGKRQCNMGKRRSVGRDGTGTAGGTAGFGPALNGFDGRIARETHLVRRA